MAIRKALLHGKIVYAERGEELRGADLICIHCGAKMHLHKFPAKEGYFFSTNPGYEHQSVCRVYAGKKDAPVLDSITPDELIAMISKIRKKRRVAGGENGEKDANGGDDDGDEEYRPQRMTGLLQLVKTGTYDVNPFDKVGHNSSYIYMDFVIYDKWGIYFWGRKQDLVKLGPRVIDARWVGSMNFDKQTNAKILKLMRENKEIWLSMYWFNKDKEEYEFVRFCLVCENSMGLVKKKLFTSVVKSNGTLDNFKPKKDPLDIMVGAVWGVMTKEQCEDSCPLKHPKNKYCNNCKGAYGCVINSEKQIILFPDDSMTKNKGKKYYDTDI